MNQRKRLLSLIVAALLLVMVAVPMTFATAENAGEPQKVSLVFVNPGARPFDEEPANAEVYELVKAKYLADRNVDLEITIKDCSWTGYQDLMQVEMAANTQIDLFPAWSDMANMFISNDMIYPMDEALTLYGQNILEVIPELAWRWMDVDGQCYGLPRLRAENDVDWIVIRKDWLDMCNLEVPTTYEEFEQALYAFRDLDPVGNGNTIPYQARFEAGANGTGYWLQANQMTDYYLGEDGQVHYLATNENLKVALDKTEQWIEDGIYNKDVFSVSNDEHKMRLSQHIVGAKRMKVSAIISEYETMRAVYPEGEYVVVPFASDDQERYEKSKVASDFLLVPANSKNLENVISFFDWMLEDKDNFLLMRYGIEGEHFVKVGDQIDIIEGADGNAQYSGVLTGSFDMYGLEGYGSDAVVNFVQLNFDDPVKQSIYENEFRTLSGEMFSLQDTAIVPNLFGFTYKLDGVAQQTRDQRRSAFNTACAEYVTGACDWAKVETAVNNYLDGTGGQEEFEMVNAQYVAWAEHFNTK